MTANDPVSTSSADSSQPLRSSDSAAKPSPMEAIKRESLYLKGSISEELGNATDHFGKSDLQLLKFHGTYQQDDRDRRAAARAEGRDRAYMFMVRSKIPGGKLTSEQLLAQIQMGDEFGNQTLRITTRQGLQLHGVLKSNLAEVIAKINATQLTTLGACGDVNRNVMCCPAPHKGALHDQMQQLADRIADHLAPQTTAYHEIWLQDANGDGSDRTRVAGGPQGHTIEPIYGDVYMPRKFKIGIALPEDNCIDLHTHDLGLLAVTEGDAIVGFNVLVGGGMGVTPSAKKTFPAVAKPLCFIPAEQALDVVTAVVKVQRDFGNRSDRKIARLKYLVADWGIPKIKTAVEEYFGSALEQPRDVPVTAQEDHLGWGEQGDGNWYYGLNVENGRILDNDQMQLKSALVKICTSIRPKIRLTAHQSILFCDVAPGDKQALTDLLTAHHVPLSESISPTRRWSMACVAWPTCGLSITEAERALPEMMTQLETEIQRLGLSSEKFNLRMTGCPNGCARPYNSDIGLVGKAKGKYTVLLGGRQLGDRLNWIYKDSVPADDVIPELTKVFAYFASAKEANECFGDFCDRKGQEDILAWTDANA